MGFDLKFYNNMAIVKQLGKELVMFLPYSIDDCYYDVQDDKIELEFFYTNGEKEIIDIKNAIELAK